MNIFQLRHQRCIRGDGTNWQSEHGPFVLDEKLTEVTCGNCDAKLSPMAVLIAYARKENAIHRKFESLQLEIKKAQFKAERQNRVRCEHCAKLTRIRKAVE